MISVCVGATRGATITDLVSSVIKQTYENWELILVAQGDDPTLLDACHGAERLDPRVHSIRMTKRGRSAALNRGIAIARGDIIAFTDDDCEVAPDWLETIAGCFAREPRVGLVAGDLLPAPVRGLHVSACPATRTIECIYDPAAHGYVGPPGFYWGGANLAVRRSALQRIGLFDESLGVGTDFPSAEDTDFGLRAEELGIVMWTTPRAVVHHTHGRRSGLRAFLRHQRAYARGSGGLLAKLTLWNHRVAREWGQQKPATPIRRVQAAIRSRGRFLIDLYRRPYSERARAEYTARYELGPGRIARPRSASTACVESSP